VYLQFVHATNVVSEISEGAEEGTHEEIRAVIVEPPNCLDQLPDDVCILLILFLCLESLDAK
jgi:hypothetical protein